MCRIMGYVKTSQKPSFLPFIAYPTNQPQAILKKTPTAFHNDRKPPTNPDLSVCTAKNEKVVCAWQARMGGGATSFQGIGFYYI